MLNQVKPDGTYLHVNRWGLCNWAYRVSKFKSKQYLASEEPDTETPFGILCHFHPVGGDMVRLRQRHKNTEYWGSDHRNELHGILTDLRATILCFCAAINNEL
jgi:hypothetical protein